MAEVKVTQSLIDDNNAFNPIKYFVSRHSFYPNIISIRSNCNIGLLFEILKDKFNEFNYFSKSSFSNNELVVESFYLIFSESKSTIIFECDGCFLNYYSNDVDEGMLNILSTIINNSNAK